MKYKELVKNAVIFAVGGFGTKIILFLLVPLYTNYLTPEEYGISELVFTISQFLVPIITLNVFDAVIRFGLSTNDNKDDVLLSSLLVWGCGAIVLACGFPILRQFAAIQEWTLYLIAYVVLSGVTQIELNYLKVIGKNFAYSGISIVQSGVLALCNILMISILQMGIRGYLLSNIISLMATSVLCFIYGGMRRAIKMAKIDGNLLYRMIIYSTPLILNNISWWFIHSTDKLMINSMVGATALGIYTVAGKIPSMLNVVSGFFVQAWGISSIKEVETSNDSEFYAGVFNVFTGLILILCIILNSIIKPFMLVYTGESFNTAWTYVPPLLVAAIFNAVSSYFAAFYAALKKSVNNMITTIVGALANISINYMLIPRIGPWGAVIGTLCAYFIVAYLRIVDVKRYLRIDIRWGRHFASIVITFIHMVCIVKQIQPVLMTIIALVVMATLYWKEIQKAILMVKKKRV